MEKTAKKFLAGILVLSMLCLLAGCGENEESIPEVATTFENQESREDETQVFVLNTESQGEETDSVAETTAAQGGLPKKIENPDLVTDSEAYCVIDDQNQVWMGKNELEAKAPASITKVMTALVAYENSSLEDKVTITEPMVQKGIAVMSSGVTPSLKPGEQLSVKDLLYALILPSTNAAGNALAIHVAGSIDAFADKMNAKAKELGLRNTHFMNPHGLDAEGHYVSAYDMCLILKAALQYPDLATVLGAKTYTIPNTGLAPDRTFTMGHQLVSGSYFCEGVYAGKNGWTVQAQGTAVTAVERNGKKFYVCTLCSDEGAHYQDTDNIINYVYANANQTNYVTHPLVHDISVSAANASGVDISFSVDNEAVASRIVYWGYAEGNQTAISKELPAPQKKNTIHLDLSYKEAYQVQLFAKNSTGVEEGLGFCILNTGNLPPEGIFEFEGSRYMINDRHLLMVGAIEIPSGNYYADQRGALIFNNFAGGKFYMDQNGHAVTGWQTIEGQKYYFQADGRVVAGSYTVDGVAHNFTDYGALIN